MDEINLIQIVGTISSIGVIIGVYMKLIKTIEKEIKDNNPEIMARVDTLVDNKIGRYDKIEIHNRELRNAKYELEMNGLNKRLDACLDKLISIESEIKDDNGINAKILTIRLSLENLKK